MADLDDIRHRAMRATPGPWQWFGNDDRVYLATTHSGRLYVLGTGVRRHEYVFDHHQSEAYTVEEARKRYVRDVGVFADRPYWDMDLAQLSGLARARGLTVANAEDPDELPIEDDYIEALENWDFEQDEDFSDLERQIQRRDGMSRIVEFFDWDLGEDEGARHLTGRDGDAWLSRSVQHHPDLQFAEVDGPRSWNSSGRMRSYQALARYEVLNGRTLAEHTAADGMVNGERRDLYRDDIVGIDSPDAEFIARARSDIDRLLEAIDRLNGLQIYGRVPGTNVKVRGWA